MGTIRLGTAVLLTAALFASPAEVRAHAVLVYADPAPNSVIPAAPPELVLVFSEPVDPASVRIGVTDADRRPVAGVGSPTVDSRGVRVSVSLPTLDPDTYTVDYAVVSAVDGHPTASLFAFVIDPTGTASPPVVEEPASATPADPAAIAARWATTIAVLLLVGTVVVWVIHRRRLGAERLGAPPWRALASVAAVGLAALVGHLTLAASAAFGAGGSSGVATIPFDPAAPFGWTPFALAMRMALLGYVLALGGSLVALVRARRRSPDAPASSAGEGPLLALCGAAGVVVVLGLSLTGHAASLGGALGAATDAAHLLAVAAWFGALPALGLAIARLRAAPGGTVAPSARAVLAAHAPVALVAAPLVVLTGLANSPLVVGEPRELAAADYGNLILSKAWLASVALALGAANFFLARTSGRHRFIPVVALEAVVAALAVAVGTTMVSLPPAVDRPPAVADPHLGVAHLYGESGMSAIHGVVDLPEPGVQGYAFSVSDPQTGLGREDVSAVVVTFVPPPGSGLPNEVELAHPGVEPWVWELHGAFTPVVGQWELEVVVRGGLRGEDRIVLPLAVREVMPPVVLPPPTTGGEALAVLAAPATILPPGPAGWVVPVGLLAAVVAAAVVQRRVFTSRWVAIVKVTVVVLAVASGVSLLARDLVVAANAAPPEWRAAVNPLAGDPAAAAAGEELYLANCASCHGADGAGDGPLAADLVRPPPDLAASVPGRTDGELGWTIAGGVAGTQMPAFGTTLLDGERWELVSFLRSRWPSGGE